MLDRRTLRSLSALALTLICGLSAAQTTWEKYRIEVRNPLDAQRLAESDLCVLDCHIHEPFSDVAVNDLEFGKLLSLGLPFSKIGDLEDPRNYSDRYAAPAMSDFTLNYQPLADIYGWFDSWVAAYPRMWSRQQLGTTAGARPIYAYKLAVGRGAPANKKSVVITSLVHAREWVTGAISLYTADQLTKRALRTREYAKLLNNIDVVFVPVHNPDGYSYTWTNTRLWRKNRRNNGNGSFGVDVNRNFPTGWGLSSGSSGNTGSETYRGPSAGSEPETQAYISLMNSLTNPKASIDFHSYSQLLMWPWGYQSTALPSAVTAKFVAMCTPMRNAVQANGGLNYAMGPVYSTIYPASGVTLDHFYALRGTLATTIEARDTGTYGFQLPEDQILPAQIENFAAVDQMIRYVYANP